MIVIKNMQKIKNPKRIKQPILDDAKKIDVINDEGQSDGIL